MPTVTVRKYRPKAAPGNQVMDIQVHVPDWCEVEFPTGKRFTYLTLEKANNARIMARAWDNWRKALVFEKSWLGTGQIPKFRETGWSAFARHLGIAKDRKQISPRTGRPLRGGMSSNAGEPFYQHCARGTLPKDPKVRQTLYDLAGYPWK